jgi:hypothetical protein
VTTPLRRRSRLPANLDVCCTGGQPASRGLLATIRRLCNRLHFEFSLTKLEGHAPRGNVPCFSCSKFTDPLVWCPENTRTKAGLISSAKYLVPAAKEFAKTFCSYQGTLIAKTAAKAVSQLPGPRFSDVTSVTYGAANAWKLLSVVLNFNAPDSSRTPAFKVLQSPQSRVAAAPWTCTCHCRLHSQPWNSVPPMCRRHNGCIIFSVLAKKKILIAITLQRD